MGYKTGVCSDRKCRSLQLQYKTKINEFSLIGKEERVKIDNLLRKEIVKIYENKLEKKKMPDIKDSFKNNENLEKNSNNFILSNSTKVINRKLIIATNSILNLLEDLFKFISIIPYLKNMIELKKSLGGMSDQIPAQLLPGTKNPNLIIFSKKNSLYLWNPKTKVILAVLEEVNEISKKITNLKLS